jgi:hypothetical protein
VTPLLPDLPLDLSALKPASPLALAPGGASLAEGGEADLSDFAQLIEASRAQPDGARAGPMAHAGLESPLEAEPDAARGVPQWVATHLPAMPSRAASAGGNPLPLAGEGLPGELAAADSAGDAVPARTKAHQAAPRGVQMLTLLEDAPVDRASAPPTEVAGSLAALHQTAAPRPLDEEASDAAPLRDPAEAGEPVAVANIAASVAAHAAPLAPVMAAPRLLPARANPAVSPAPIPTLPDAAGALPDGQGSLVPLALRPTRNSPATVEPAFALSPPPALASPTSAAAPALALAPSPALVAEAGAALAGGAAPAPASAADPETVLDQIATLRDAARSARSDVVLRHGEFGTVHLRIDAAGAPGEWRAALTSRDPGFVPAVQAALAERAVAASSEAGANFSQQHGGNSSASNAGSGLGQGSGQSAYGFSQGGGQGSSQQYSGQTATEGQGHLAASSGAANATGQITQSDGDLFA